MCNRRFSWVAARNARVAPSPLSHRVPRNWLSDVGCGVLYDGLTHCDLASGEVVDAEGSPRVVSVDAEHDVLDPAWRQLVLGFGSPQVCDGSKRDEGIKRGPVSDPEFVWEDYTEVEGCCRTTISHFSGVGHGLVS